MKTHIRRANLTLRRMSIILGIQCMIVASALTQIDTTAFSSASWDLTNAEVVDYLGRKCLIGTAFLKNVEFENGVIEVDIAVDAAGGRRTYPGVLFRVQSDDEYERVYLRPHRAGLYPDAIQYVPAFNGVDSWQLYNGDGATAGALIPNNQWIRWRIEVIGTQARVFLGDTSRPSLFIKDLKHGLSKGSVGLSGQRDRSAFFSNFRYRRDNTLQFPVPQVPEPAPGIVTEWSLSQPYKVAHVDIEVHPRDQGLSGLRWKAARSDPSGLVDIARSVKPFATEPSCVFAKTTIRATKEEVKQFALGYSDIVTVFLNGKALFSGNSTYRQRDPSFLGIIGLNDYVYLPLKKGDNELMLAVAESFGGWGFMVRDAKAIFQHEGLTKLWELPRKLRFPESVLYDRKRNVLYVSNYLNDGREFLSRVKLNGEIETLEWVQGLVRPTGMALQGDKLFVVERANLVEIDLTSGKIVKKYPIPEARFPNDIAVDSAGSIYISDTQRNAVVRFRGGQSETWLQATEIGNPNGLFVDKNRLLVGASLDGSIKAVNLNDKKIRNLVTLGSGAVMDGIQPGGAGNILISDYNGKIYLVSETGQKTLLLNTTAPGYFCADFAYLPEEGLLVVPTLADNRLMAFKFKVKK